MNRRGFAAITVLVLWAAGLLALYRREAFRPQTDRLAAAALRVTPEAVYYAVLQGTQHVGFASSTIDTAEAGITIADYFVADIPVGGKSRRTTARTNVTLSRGLALRRFDASLDAQSGVVRAIGRVEGDSVLILVVTTGAAPADTQRFPLTGAVLLPNLVPLAVALGEEPKRGRSFRFPVFDPIGMQLSDVEIQIRAETTFVVHDSAIYDPGAAIWRPAQPFDMKAWLIGTGGNSGITGWIDEQGRIVRTSQLGFELRRMPYEVAFSRWRAAAQVDGGEIDSDRDILETTAIAARRADSASGATRLAVVLGGVDLEGYELNSPRQTLRGDTLFIEQEPAALLHAAYELPAGGRSLARAYTRSEPLIQTGAPQIAALARRLRGDERDPRVVAERIMHWVHDSLGKEITFGIPSALDVLRAGRGDCNEHTQLFVALARAAGIPARTAAGLAYIGGKFYYHAWPEVLLADWVAVDPTLGQFPADAAHLRFVVGGLTRQAELLRLIGTLTIDVASIQ